jgi:hypothetical protein
MNATRMRPQHHHKISPPRTPHSIQTKRGAATNRKVCRPVKGISPESPLKPLLTPLSIFPIPIRAVHTTSAKLPPLMVPYAEVNTPAENPFCPNQDEDQACDRAPN